MPTQDDTFRHLWRMPWQELWDGPVETKEEIFKDFIYNPFGYDELAALAKYGWTELEFKKEYKKILEADDSHPLMRPWWSKLEKEIKRLEDLDD